MMATNVAGGRAAQPTDLSACLVVRPPDRIRRLSFVVDVVRALGLVLSTGGLVFAIDDLH
jgi:hypothetical protein